MTRVAAVLALAACHHPPVHQPGEEFVSAVRFEGNRVVGSGDLRPGLALTRAEKSADAPDPYLVDADVERLRGNYIRRGFVDVEVHARVERAGDAATVIFAIAEGPRAATRVDIAGVADPALRDTIRKALPLADGAPFDYAVYDKARELLLAAAQNAGYAHAQLLAHVIGDREHHLAIVQLMFELGPACRFGQVHIEGVTGELADAAAQRVAFEPGDRYSTAKLAATQRALYGMQRFSTVRVLPDKDSGEVVDVHISLAEASRHELRLGGGLVMDPLTFGARLRAGYRVAGFPGPLDTADVDLQPAYAVLRDTLNTYEPRVRALATVSRMDFIEPFVTGTMSGGYNYLVVEAYTSYGPEVHAGIDTPLGTPRLHARLGWRFEYLGFRDLNPLVDPAEAHALGLDHSERLGAYEQSLVLDLRDDPRETRAGGYAEVRVAEGTPAAGGAASFFEVVPEARGYVPLWRVTLAARIKYGAIFGDVVPSERFYAGGASSQRGFSERQLAPTLAGDVNGSFTSVPVGGAALIDSSLEARVPLGHIRGMGVAGVVFLDGGDVTNTVSELDPLDLNWAIGGGLRLLTVVGPVRVDVGYRLNRKGPNEPEPDSSYAFHISLGEAF